VTPSPTATSIGNQDEDLYRNEFLNFAINLSGKKPSVYFYQNPEGNDHFGLSFEDGWYFAFANPITNVPEGKDGFFGDITGMIKPDDTLLSFCEQHSDASCRIYTNTEGVRYTRLEGQFEMGDSKDVVYVFPLKTSSPEWRLIAFTAHGLSDAELKRMVDSFRYLR
jgi:hypothetical protein